MSAYFFADTLEVTNPEKMEQYREVVLATVEQFGGRYLTVGGQCDVVEGDWRPVFPVLIEFPSFEQARLWYESEVYRGPKALRHEAARCNAVLMEGKPFERPAASRPRRRVPRRRPTDARPNPPTVTTATARNPKPAPARTR